MSRPIALIAGVALALGCASALAPGRPSFEASVARAHAPLWDTGACQSRGAIFGICRMLRPVRG